MLTLQELKEMKPNTIFVSGNGLVQHPFEPKLIEINWVAIRGGIHDWAIYYSLSPNLEPTPDLAGEMHLFASKDLIAAEGSKLRDEEKIREFVPCDDEAFEMYRY